MSFLYLKATIVQTMLAWTHPEISALLTSYLQTATISYEKKALALALRMLLKTFCLLLCTTTHFTTAYLTLARFTDQPFLIFYSADLLITQLALESSLLISTEVFWDMSALEERYVSIRDTGAIFTSAMT